MSEPGAGSSPAERCAGAPGLTTALGGRCGAGCGLPPAGEVVRSGPGFPASSRILSILHSWVPVISVRLVLRDPGRPSDLPLSLKPSLSGS